MDESVEREIKRAEISAALVDFSHTVRTMSVDEFDGFLSNRVYRKAMLINNWDDITSGAMPSTHVKMMSIDISVR